MFKKFIYICCFINQLLLFTLGYTSWYKGDDYIFNIKINQYQSVIRNMYEGYLTWDGRFISPHAFLQLNLINIFSPELAGIIHLLLFLGTIFILFYFITRSSKKSLIILLLSSTLIFWGIQQVVSQTIFWITGGIYINMLFLLSLWLLLTYHLIPKVDNNIDDLFSVKYVFLVAITFIVGICGPDIMCAMLAGLLSIGLFEWYKSKKSLMKISGLFLILVASGLFTILAPGNDIRISKQIQTPAELNVFSWIENFFVISFEYIASNWQLFFALPIVAMIVLPFCEVEDKSKGMLKYKKVIVLVATGFGSLAPFLVYPWFAKTRTSLPLSIMLFFGILILFIAFLNKVTIIKEVFSHDSKLTMILWLVSLVSTSAFLIHQNYDSYLSYKEFNKRHEYLMSQNGSNRAVIIKGLENKPPIVKEFREFRVDTNYWINKHAARYYGIMSLKLDSINK